MTATAGAGLRHHPVVGHAAGADHLGGLVGGRGARELRGGGEADHGGGARVRGDHGAAGEAGEAALALHHLDGVADRRGVDAAEQGEQVVVGLGEPSGDLARGGCGLLEGRQVAGVGDDGEARPRIRACIRS